MGINHWQWKIPKSDIETLLEKFFYILFLSLIGSDGIIDVNCCKNIKIAEKKHKIKINCFEHSCEDLNRRLIGKKRIFRLYKNKIVDWNTGKKFCENEGGNLAIIENAEQNKIVTDFFINNTLPIYSGRGELWIGVTDQVSENTTEGVYIYTNGQRLSSSYQHGS